MSVALVTALRAAVVWRAWTISGIAPALRGGAMAMIAAVLLACSDGGSPETPAGGAQAAAGAGEGGGGSAAGAAGAERDASTAAAGAGAGQGGGSAADAGRCGSTCPDAAADAGSAGAADGSSAPGPDASSCTPCTSYGQPELLANVQVAALAELSGIAASVRNPGVLFAHNDRARADVYALAQDGSLRAQFALADAEPEDIEDIAVGPCPQGTCVYLADVGGNLSPRTEFAILRFAEPAVPSSGAAATERVAFERFRFEYDDGANHNAEGLLVEPGAGAVYVVTKMANGQPSSVYALPHPLVADALNVATRAAELPIPATGDMAASAAAAHPCGGGFLVRTYNAIYEFRAAAGAPFADAFAVEPMVVPSADEPQSEGISYLPDGRGYVSAGEGASAPIYRALCE